ncbi:unnamed protein product [Periconia digitata]|uniref:Uncharacterized protein n=1 Tax=Periconia digitata TaxID=1303443 RepID=A0A9W4XQQ4_9PLEO|nr:unnamed protein product [Periconia digitata]
MSERRRDRTVAGPCNSTWPGDSLFERRRLLVPRPLPESPYPGRYTFSNIRANQALRLSNGFLQGPSTSPMPRQHQPPRRKQSGSSISLRSGFEPYRPPYYVFMLGSKFSSRWIMIPSTI